MAYDLISRSALLKAMRTVTDDTTCPMHIAAEIEQYIGEAPAVDAVEVVRCKGCKYFIQKVDVGGFCKCGEVNGGIPHIRANDDYCNYGERRADDGK